MRLAMRKITRALIKNVSILSDRDGQQHAQTYRSIIIYNITTGTANYKSRIFKFLNFGVKYTILMVLKVSETQKLPSRIFNNKSIRSCFK